MKSGFFSRDLGEIPPRGPAPFTLQIVSSDEVPADLDAALRAVVAGRLRDRGMSGNALATAVGKASSSFSRQLRGFGLFSVQDWSDIATALDDDLEGLLEDARQRLRHLGDPSA